MKCSILVIPNLLEPNINPSKTLKNDAALPRIEAFDKICKDRC